MTDGAAPRKRRALFNWKAIVGILLSVAGLWYALRDVDLHEVAREIGHADPLLYLLSVFLATAVFWIRGWRWGTLLSSIAPRTSYRSLVAATTIGFMGNNLMPARIGEFARAYAFSRMEKVTIVASFGSLVVERLFDAIGIIGLLFFTMTMPDVPDVTNLGGYNFSALGRTVGGLAVAGLILAIALVVFPARTVSFVETYFARFLPTAIRRPFVDALEAFLSGLTALRSPGILGIATLQTAVLWLFNALGFWIAFKAFGIDLPFTAALLLQSVIALFVSVPSGPGFWGLYELAARVVLVDAYGISREKAIGFAIGFHIGGFIPVTLIGLYYAWRLGISLREVEASEEVVEEAVEATLPLDHRPL